MHYRKATHLESHTMKAQCLLERREQHYIKAIKTTTAEQYFEKNTNCVQIPLHLIICCSGDSPMLAGP